MSSELQLVTTRDFNGITFNCYVEQGQRDPQDFWATRTQIGQLLGYEDPEDAVKKIHARHKERIDKFSRGDKLSLHEETRTVTREVVLYDFKGLLEICRYSNQPVADAVMDVLWDIADEIRRTGSYSVKHEPEAPSQYQIDQLNLERARFLQHMIDAPAFPLTDESKAIIQHEAFKMLTGHECLAMLPALTEQWYTAEDIGRELGITGCKVGHIANKHGLKPELGQSNEYGRWTVSKSRNSRKEVPQFIYSQHALDWFTSYRDGRLLEA
ncbi:MAG: hypothetical protein IJS28_07110 [Synergistaceae bacterium]|nr:hypothetical protein [Synergistaceae bacterium]